MYSIHQLLLIIFCLFVAPLTISAQHGLGIQLGPNISTIYGTGEDPPGRFEQAKFRPGFQAGLVWNAYVNDLFSVMTSVNYEMRKGSKELKEEEFLQIQEHEVGVYRDQEVVHTLGYLNVPVLAAFGPAWFKIYLGPNAAYLLHAKGKRSSATSINLPQGLDPNTPGLPVEGEVKSEVDYLKGKKGTNEVVPVNRFEIGANVGVRLFLSEHLFLDFNIHHGLLDVTNEEEAGQGLLGNEPQDRDDLPVVFKWNVGWIF